MPLDPLWSTRSETGSHVMVYHGACWQLSKMCNTIFQSRQEHFQTRTLKNAISTEESGLTLSDLTFCILAN